LDEAFTLHTTGAGPLFAWRQAIAFEGQPPFYFVVESVWRTLNETSIAFARFPSTVFASAAVAIIVLAAHRIAPRTPSLAVALVTALNPIVIWAAVEMRLYALVLLIGAILTWAFFAGFLAPERGPRARVFYTLFAIVGLYTQYYVGFLLLAHLIALLALRRRSVLGLSIALAIVAVAFAPFVPAAMVHVAGRSDFVAQVTLMHAAHALANAAFVSVLPHDPNWTGAVKFAGFAGAGLLVGAFFVVGRPRMPAGPQRGVVLAWLVCLALLGAMFSAFGLPLEALHHTIVVVPSTLLVALLFTASLKRKRRIAGCAAAAAFALFALTQLLFQYHSPLAKQGDWQRVAGTLSAEGGSAPIAVFPAELAVPLSWYLRRAMIPLPAPIPFTTAYVRASTLNASADVSRVLDPIRARSRNLWLVTTGECTAVAPQIYDYHCRYLDAYLNRRYQLARTVAFRGTLVRLYRRLPQVSSGSRTVAHAN
jgi:hypothetical protein